MLTGAIGRAGKADQFLLTVTNHVAKRTVDAQNSPIGCGNQDALGDVLEHILGQQQRLLGALARTYVAEHHDRPGVVVGRQRGTGESRLQVCAVAPPQGGFSMLAVEPARLEQRVVCVTDCGCIAAFVGQPAAEQFPGGIAEQPRTGRIHESDPSCGIEPEYSFAGRVQQQALAQFGHFTAPDLFTHRLFDAYVIADVASDREHEYAADSVCAA